MIGSQTPIAGDGLGATLHLGSGPPVAGSNRNAASPMNRGRSRWAQWLEALGVGLAPAIAALVLRLRLMAPSSLVDPGIHTSFVVDPSQVFARYAVLYAGTGRLREAAEVGFIVPARLAYLSFGAVPGFFVFRYVLALVAVGPVYLLLRRVYGRPAGVVGVLVVLSSPVIVTAWGTDYPDSAVVSYAAGALACLAMPCAPRWRRGWISAAALLLTLAVWSDVIAVPLAGATLICYLGVRLARDRAGLLGDLAVLAGVSVAVTGLLVVAFSALIAHGNFIAITWQSYRFMAQPGQARRWHSASWRWAPYVAYLLVPPAVLGAWTVAIARRGRAVPTAVLLAGIAAAGQLAAYAWLQFAGSVQALEYYFASSTLWGAVCLVLAVTLAELARPLAGRPLARWVPAAVLLAVALGYEADPHVPPFGWVPLGATLAAAVIIAAIAARGATRLRGRLAAATATALAMAALVGATLVLTVAPIPPHPRLPGTLSAHVTPPPPYASALGGSATVYIDRYRIAAALPFFVGQPAYAGERVLMWWPSGNAYVEYAGVAERGAINTLPGKPPDLTADDRKVLGRRRPAELLLFDSSAASFPAALKQLADWRPVLVRSGVLSAGRVVLHVWLVRLGTYYR
jgi:hypothetical protein